MALASNDNLLVWRTGVGMRRIEVGNITTLTSGDLLLVQRTSGTGNLKKIDWADKDTDLQNDDIFLVQDVDATGKPCKKTTWNALKAFLSTTATILASGNGSSSNENLTLDDLFTSSQLGNNSAKIIDIESGAIVGGNTSGGIALDISSTNTVNGTITINNNGTIVGRQGGLSSINGGTAISFSKNATLVNNGTISGGGGKGGDGGQGGNGTTTSSGGSTGVSTASCDQQCAATYGAGSTCVTTTQNCSQIYCIMGICRPCGNSQVSACQLASPPFWRCLSCNVVTTTTGGAGGAGGFGAGFTSSSTNVSNSSGSSGASPGGNAGAGGQGGAGGDYGQAGFAGTSGANGNSTNGSAASSPGSAGSSIAKNSNTVTVTNNGTINGSITT